MVNKIMLLESDHFPNRRVTMETNHILKGGGSEMRVAVLREAIELWYPPSDAEEVEVEE